MKFDKFLSINLGIIYSFFSLGLSGYDLGLYSFLTMRTIALSLLLTCLCFVFIYEKGFNFILNQYFYIILSVLFLIFFWILLSYLFSEYQNLVSITEILAWLTIPICMILTYKIIKYFKLDIFMKSVVLIQVIALVTIFVWSVANVGDPTNYIGIRLFINGNLEVGLNRFLNGVMFLNVISLIIILGIYNSSKYIFLLSLINVFLSFYLSFISGSRQSLIALFLSIFVIIVINRYMRGEKGVNFKGIIFTSVSIILIINLFQIEGVSKWIEERFIDKTTEQLTTGDIRTDIYEEALYDAKNNLIFGTGPGTYHQVSSIGMHTHNGYLYMLNNFGVIPVVLIVFLFSSLALKGINKKHIINNNQKRDTFIVIFSTFIVFIFMNLFNDLITMLSFWIAIVIIIDCFNIHSKKYVDSTI
ncbi:MULTISPECIES: O-antigen ligase family protein [unclassified Oceanobacillus]|uniref:O-antigen ligase family protein n=1 Tax=unclassified Oceanobacillus TaxID=2630292 RepID=UPI001BE84BA1|nr:MULTISPECIES: O-antigen ligase family protein [unclassified Oceanobacillus]MBT2600522.1 O-antigen ligase family protein [Oceanobacillus sp. ISL-74]MBT2650680.1 O-antigen ligase family protein [Oceanobacillus sp. ISL-73]